MNYWLASSATMRRYISPLRQLVLLGTFILVAILFNLITAVSQPPLPEPFLKSAGGSANDLGLDVATDSNSNVFLTGAFQGTAHFEDTRLTSFGGNDVIIAKYSSNGTLQWVKQAGGLASDAGWAIAVDAMNNIIVAGEFSATAAFDDTLLTAQGATDIFIAKYNTNGELLWAQSAGGSGTDMVRGLVVDNQNNAYITGSFRNSATFGGIRLRSESDRTAMFLAKYTPMGRALWAQQSVGAGSSTGYDVDLDSQNNAYMTGEFADEIVFEDRSINPVQTTSIASAGASDIFLAKFDVDGDFQWVMQAGGPESDRGTNIAVDGGNNIFVAGFIRSTADFEDISVTSLGQRDIFIAEYNNSGVFQWVESDGGPADDLATGLADTNDNSLILTARFESTWLFDNRLVSSAGASDILVAKFDNDGVLKWAIDAGGPGSDAPRGVAADSGGNAYVTGNFSGSADFDDFVEESLGGLDIFLAKFDQNGFLRP